MRKIAAERRCRVRRVDGGAKGVAGREEEGADDRRKIVANDGEVKAASSSFSLPAFVLLGVPTTAQGRYSYRAATVPRRKRLTRKMFRSVESFEKIDKNEESSNYKRRKSKRAPLYIVHHIII